MSNLESHPIWFQDVFDKNYEYIRNYIYYLSGDMDLSEDLTQDVFLKLLEKANSVNLETVRPFLYTIAKNAYLVNKKRELFSLRFVSSLLDNHDNESPEYLQELKEFDEHLQKVISDLPDRCRLIFLMNRSMI